MKTLAYGLLALVVLGAGWYLLTHQTSTQGALAADIKNLTFTISGKPITFINGAASTPAAPGSASMVTTRYFGNDVTADLNGDGTADKAFLVTQDSGGSGTFYYLVGALKEAGGYRGTQALLIGDRIAPQTTEFKDGLVIVNYAVRKPGEPFTTPPSVGKSLYLKYDPSDMSFGEVVQNFEGESDTGITGSVLLGPTCPVERIPPDPGCADKPYATKLVITTPDGAQVIKEFNSDASGHFTVALAAGTYAIRSAAAANILPYCQAEPFVVTRGAYTSVNVSCDPGIR